MAKWPELAAAFDRLVEGFKPEAAAGSSDSDEAEAASLSAASCFHQSLDSLITASRDGSVAGTGAQKAGAIGDDAAEWACDGSVSVCRGVPPGSASSASLSFAPPVLRDNRLDRVSLVSWMVTPQAGASSGAQADSSVVGAARGAAGAAVGATALPFAALQEGEEGAAGPNTDEGRHAEAQHRGDAVGGETEGGRPPPSAGVGSRASLDPRASQDGGEGS